jgi:hypothetical protein
MTRVRIVGILGRLLLVVVVALCMTGALALSGMPMDARWLLVLWLAVVGAIVFGVRPRPEP